MPLAKILGVGCPGLYAWMHVWKGERKLTNVDMGGFWITSEKGRKGQGGANSLGSGREWVQGVCSAYCGGREEAAQRSWAHKLHCQPDSTAGRRLPQFSAECGRWDTACFPHLCDLLPPPTPCFFCTLSPQCLSSPLLLPRYLTTHPQLGWPKLVLEMTEPSVSFQ